jgi:hypothetical protein
VNPTIILVILSSIFTVVSTIPYIIEIIRGTTKPRVISWFIWSVLTGVAGVASYVDGQIPTTILMFFATIETLLIVILGWKHGNRKIERFDIICLVGAIVGIILWQVFNSPAIAVIATVAIDLVGGLPTLVHSWNKPHEETWSTFFLAFLGALCTVLALTEWKITSFAYPLYLVVINFMYVTVLLVRRKHAVAGEPEEFRRL